MGFLDRLFGRREGQRAAPAERGASRSEDEKALERYRYLVRTAPPERVEQAHEEAFAALTPDQRRMALQQLSRVVPYEEAAGGDDPRSLARMATRAEMRRPGTVERAFAGGGGFGGMGMGVPLLGAFATAFVGTLAAQALFADLADGELIDQGPGDLGGGDFGGGGFSGGDFGGGDFGGI